MQGDALGSDTESVHSTRASKKLPPKKSPPRAAKTRTENRQSVFDFDQTALLTNLSSFREGLRQGPANHFKRGGSFLLHTSKAGRERCPPTPRPAKISTPAVSPVWGHFFLINPRSPRGSSVLLLPSANGFIIAIWESAAIH